VGVEEEVEAGEEGLGEGVEGGAAVAGGVVDETELGGGWGGGGGRCG